MRDPARIHKFCNRLAQAWLYHPDWRFGQLIVNVFGELNRDPFFPEDEEMIEFIEKCLIRGNSDDGKSNSLPTIIKYSDIITYSDKEKE